MNRAKIMVVEDEWIVADQICRNLQKLGYEVPPPLSSGTEAIRRIEEEKPDLVIMDIVLQGEMDGIETANQITEKFDIPVIYLTAYTCQDLIERAKLTKPFSYLVKPFEDSELQCNIEIALHKHQADRQLKARHALLEKNLRGTIDAIVTKI